MAVVMGNCIGNPQGKSAIITLGKKITIKFWVISIGLINFFFIIYRISYKYHS
jgi:hypothetical protein